MGKKRNRRVNAENPVSVLDVAAYIVEKQPKRLPLTAWKLQKLVYYSQAWSLVWDEKPLFRERIEAWINGPVVPNLYRIHRGEYFVTTWPHGSAANLSSVQRDTIDAVLEFYGDK